MSAISAAATFVQFDVDSAALLRPPSRMLDWHAEIRCVKHLAEHGNYCTSLVLLV